MTNSEHKQARRALKATRAGTTGNQRVAVDSYGRALRMAARIERLSFLIARAKATGAPIGDLTAELEARKASFAHYNGRYERARAAAAADAEAKAKAGTAAA